MKQHVQRVQQEPDPDRIAAKSDTAENQNRAQQLAPFSVPWFGNHQPPLPVRGTANSGSRCSATSWATKPSASRQMLTTKRHWCSIRTMRPGSTPPGPSTADIWLAARTAIACITAATPYSNAATIAAIRLTSTPHLPRHLLLADCPCPS